MLTDTTNSIGLRQLRNSIAIRVAEQLEVEQLPQKQAVCEAQSYKTAGGPGFQSRALLQDRTPELQAKSSLQSAKALKPVDL